jgi:anti-anti-sigma factor
MLGREAKIIAGNHVTDPRFGCRDETASPQHSYDSLKESLMLKVVTKNFGHTAILCVHGSITIGETAALRNAVEVASPANSLILDMAHVSLIDAHGLGVLLELRARSETKGIGFKLMNVTKPVSHVFELTRLNTVFELISEPEFSAAA